MIQDHEALGTLVWWQLVGDDRLEAEAEGCGAPLERQGPGEYPRLGNTAVTAVIAVVAVTAYPTNSDIDRSDNMDRE